MQQSIICFSQEIFCERSIELIEGSFQKINLKYEPIKKSNREYTTKNTDFEFEKLNEKNKNTDRLPEELTAETIDTLDIENLRSILKTKCRIIKSSNEKIQNFKNLLKEETEKNDYSKMIIKLQKKEIQKNNNQYKKDINFWREKAYKSPMNQPSNYVDVTEKKEDNLQLNDIKISGDSDISFSSKINQNEISKKWSAYENNIAINFDDLQINFRKLNDLNDAKNLFKFIDVEICNFSASTFLIHDLQLDSTESNIFFN